MSFVKKIKDILFEEEDEPTREVKIESEPVKEPKIVRIESLKDRDFVFDEQDDTEVKPRQVEMPRPEVKREVPRSENSFTFPDFDEEEFTSSMSRGRQNNNVLEYERKKKEEKRDFSRLDRVENNRDEKKKFKPSPIISPVYGILNQDYKAEDIVNRGEVASNINIDEVSEKLSIDKFTLVDIIEDLKKPNRDEVRKRAFEPKEIELPAPKHEEIIDEPVVTFFEEKSNIVKEEKDYKTIDDLLEEASTEVSLEDTIEVPNTNNLDAIEEELEKLDEEEKSTPVKSKKEEDLDNDLFELIDSMYDDREEV